MDRAIAIAIAMTITSATLTILEISINQSNQSNKIFSTTLPKNTNQ